MKKYGHLGDDVIKKMEIEQNKKLTPAERVEIVFELSDFIEEIHEAAGKQFRKKNCRWILQPAKPGIDAVYCEKPVRWKMIDDGEGNKTRKYNPFCEKHSARIDKDEESKD